MTHTQRKKQKNGKNVIKKNASCRAKSCLRTCEQHRLQIFPYYVLPTDLRKLWVNRNIIISYRVRRLPFAICHLPTQMRNSNFLFHFLRIRNSFFCV